MESHTSCAKSINYVAVTRDSLRKANKSSRSTDGPQPMMINFPSTRAILWDRRPIGAPFTLHINHTRNPTLIIEEKLLRLVQRFTQESCADTFTCKLSASLTVNQDSKSITINVDQLNAGNDNIKNYLGSAYNVNIPCTVKRNCAKPKTSTEDYGLSIQNICQRCRCKLQIRLEEFISMTAYCSYHENQQNYIFHVDFSLVTCGVKLKMVPVNSVSIVPTALSKNLAGPGSISSLQGDPKAGYLTMDQTRKLLLVLESDPKVSTLPLVGIWISGVSDASNPFVWACCLRYLFNPTLEERIVIPPEGFLVVVYTLIHSKPEFYECVTLDGSMSMKFDLRNGHEVLQMPKNFLSRAESPLEIEMLAVEAGEKKELFEAALQNNQTLCKSNLLVNDEPKKTSAEDIVPRSLPIPHFKKAPFLQPTVPEVSILLDEKDSNISAPSSTQSHLQMAATTLPTSAATLGKLSKHKAAKTRESEAKFEQKPVKAAGQVANGMFGTYGAPSFPGYRQVQPIMTGHGQGMYLSHDGTNYAPNFGGHQYMAQIPYSHPGMLVNANRQMTSRNIANATEDVIRQELPNNIPSTQNITPLTLNDQLYLQAQVSAGNLYLPGMSQSIPWNFNSQNTAVNCNGNAQFNAINYNKPPAASKSY